jgi:hypothetical protein
MKEKAGEGDWPIENALKAISEARRRSGLDLDHKPAPLRDLIAPYKRSLYPRHNNYTTNQRKSQLEITESVIKTYVELNLAALNAGEEKLIRVWYLARFLDEEGSGVVLAERVEELLACSRRNFQRLLRQGEGKYWRRCKTKRGLVLILIGLRRVFKRFNLRRFWHSRPILLPLDDLVGGIRRLRAAFYSSFIAIHNSNPISRIALKEITGVSERSQRNYDKVCGIKVRRNFALGSPPEEGRAFLTRLGGAKRWGYQLPNTYQISYLQAPKGMLSKIPASPPENRNYPFCFFPPGGDWRLYYSSNKLNRALQRRAAEGWWTPLYFRLRRRGVVQWWCEL